MSIDFSPARALVSNLRGGFGVIPGDTQPTPERKRIMFNVTLKWPLVTLAVAAVLLIASAPAGASPSGPPIAAPQTASSPNATSAYDDVAPA